MHFKIFDHRAIGMTLVALSFSAPLSATTLKQVFEQAWSGQAQSARAEQYDAQLSASQAWVPEPPTLSVSGRSDQIDANNGLREWEAEISQPIWLPGQRDRAQAVAQSEREAGIQRFAHERWQLAGELREAWWEVRLAETEQNEAERRLDETTQLAADVARRVKSGDLAPLDLNQVRASVAAAKSDLLRTKTAVARATHQFQALSKGAPLPDQPETPVAGDADSINRHPALASLIAAAASAQAKLLQASGDTRSTPEIGLTVTRERGNFTEPYQNLAKITLKIPFGSEARNQPRITAANAELVEARLQAEQAQRTVDATITTRRLELEQSQSMVVLAQERVQLAEQSDAWVEKAFRAGQLDLPARLKAESDLASARLSFSRARLEAERAVSRYNQAMGVLP
jgi:cobalt-zinc-cadmium efflux system outer membrane protein